MKPLLLVLLLALMPACMSVPAETVKPLNASVATTEATENEAIKGYRQWTRVNPEPVIITTAVNGRLPLFGSSSVPASA